MSRRYKKRKKRNSTVRILFAVLMLCIVSGLVGFYGVKFMLGGEGDNPGQDMVSASESDSDGKVDLSEINAEKNDGLTNDSGEQNEAGENSEGNLADDADDAMPKEESEPIMVDDRETIEIGLALYAYQIGSFSTRDNAERFLQEIGEKGESGIVYKDNNYKVLHIVYGNAENSGYFEESAKNISGDAFPYRIEDSLIVNCMSGEKETVEKLANDFADSMKKIGKAQQEFIEFVEGRKTLAEFNSGREGFSREFAAYGASLGNSGINGEFAEKLKSWYGVCESHMKDSVKVENEGYLKDLSDLYLDGLARIEGGLQCY